MVVNDAPGDKVRLKSTPHCGSRGVVEQLKNGRLIVRLADSGKSLRVSPSMVTNYSLAARKAWERMPDRRVGRPKGSGSLNRLSVTLRVDRQLWDRFKRAEAKGLIADRTATINTWIAEQLGKLDGDKR